MLELTGTQIAELNDAEARELVRQLCEAELRCFGHKLSAISSGGHQDAPDAGVDVRIALPPDTAPLDFVPRASAIFQVKAEPMGPSKCTTEMALGGRLRESISSILRSGGAYVICSTKDSTTDPRLAKRTAAMRNAAARSLPEHGGELVFYDRSKLENWAREYVGVQAWALDRLGQALRGWEGCGNWARDIAEHEFVEDSRPRVRHRTTRGWQPMTLQACLTRFATLLVVPRRAVRLVGLSGVGKTRLCQALFNQREFSAALPSSNALYADMARSPDPLPAHLIERLIAEKRKAIVVVDNCSASTHRVLVQIANHARSLVSVLTIEHDVSDDEPEGTDTFELSPASEEACMEIIRQLAPGLHPAIAKKVAEFSGGNGRIARLLIRSVAEERIDIGFSDVELVRRLLDQGQPHDAELHQVAQAASLFHSFALDSPDVAESELDVVAGLACVAPSLAEQKLGMLLARDVLQARGHWRAMLPPALANRLAQLALQGVSSGRLLDMLRTRSDKRLQISLFRRLGLLHSSPEAQTYVKSWLGGWTFLAASAELKDSDMQMLCNVAPIMQAELLESLRIRLALCSPDELAALARRQRFVDMLAHLAYEPNLFPVAAKLLATLAIEDRGGQAGNSASGLHKGLFQWSLSGTHAAVDLRIAVIRGHLDSDDVRMKRLGNSSLDHALHAGSVTAVVYGSFGGQPRDYGLHHETIGEVERWFRTWLGFAIDRIETKEGDREAIVASIGRHFRSLWSVGELWRDVDLVARRIAELGFWEAGWASVREILRFDHNRISDEAKRSAGELERALSPSMLLDRVLALLFMRWAHDYAGECAGLPETADWAEKESRLKRYIDGLLTELGSEPHLLPAIRDGLCRPGRTGCKWLFANRFASVWQDCRAQWSLLHHAYATSRLDGADYSALQGFICGVDAMDRELAGDILDAAVEDEALGDIFPELQCVVAIDSDACNRLLRSIAVARAHVAQYEALGCGARLDGLSDKEFCELVGSIGGRDRGWSVAVSILWCRLRPLRESGRVAGDQLRFLAAELLLRIDLEAGSEVDGSYLGELAHAAFSGREGRQVAERFVFRIEQGVVVRHIIRRVATEVLSEMMGLHPDVALPALVLPYGELRFARLGNDIPSHANPIHVAPDDLILRWIEVDVDARAHQVMLNIDAVFVGNDRIASLSPLAERLIELTSAAPQVLDAMGQQFRVDSWSGSYANAMRPYIELLRKLGSDQRNGVRAWALSLLAVREAEIARRDSVERREQERFE